MIPEEKVILLQKKLPNGAIKQHPTKTNLSVINPMAVIERLNEVFGHGSWQFTTEFLSCEKGIQKTKNGDREIYMSAVKGRLEIPEFGVVLEQYGGSTNDDKGDALKGGGTDSLTKIASYLGIGAEIYKGNGNIDGGSKTTQKVGDDMTVEYDPNHASTVKNGASSGMSAIDDLDL